MNNFSKQIQEIRKEADKSKPAEQFIVECMTMDGFLPPVIGESRASYMQKIVDYILYLRRRANDL